MRRLLAVVVALGLSVPAFAQTLGTSPANQGPVQGSAPVGETQGTDAFGQAPALPAGLDTTTMLIGGGLLVGAGVLTAVIVSNNKNDTTTTSNPTSP